jgi:hypothetical protein
VRDLPDIAILASVGPVESEEVRAALALSFTHRATHALPSAFPDAPLRWAEPYAELAEANRLPWPSLQAVEHAARAFLDPVLRGEQMAWDPNGWAWSGRAQAVRLGSVELEAREFTFVRTRLVDKELVAELRADDGVELRLRPYKPASGISEGDRVRLRGDGVLELVARSRDQGLDRGR